MGAVSFIYNLSPNSLTLTKEDEVFFQNSITKQTIDKSKKFIGNLGNLFNNISGKMENIFSFTPWSNSFTKNNTKSKTKSREEEDYELQLAMALSASLDENSLFKEGS